MDAHPNLGLLQSLAQVPDPRSRHGRQHPFSAVLALACRAILCGARGFAAIGQWAHDHDISPMHRLGFTRRPPKSGGIRKVLMALDRVALEAALTRWAEAPLGRSRAAHGGPSRPSPSTARRPAAASTARRRPPICCRWSLMRRD